MKKPEKVYPKTIPIALTDISINYVCPTSKIPLTLWPERMEFSAIYDDCDECGSHGTTRLEWTCSVCGDWHEIILDDK